MRNALKKNHFFHSLNLTPAGKICLNRSYRMGSEFLTNELIDELSK